MKYIIELPEEVKEKFDNATKDDIYGNYYDYNSVIGNAIKNSTSLEEEFEHLKADIRFRGYYDERIEDLIDEHYSRTERRINARQTL